MRLFINSGGLETGSLVPGKDREDSAIFSSRPFQIGFHPKRSRPQSRNANFMA